MMRSQETATQCYEIRYCYSYQYLSPLILQEIDLPDRFKKDQNISSWILTNPDFNKLNKLKKTSPEVFFYFFQALHLLKFEKN